MTAQRPRPKTRLAIDPDNAYARLGVAPLASIDDIKRQLSERRGKAMATRRARGQVASADDEQAIIELQELEKLIGSPAARAAYDREHPQNALLTVQAAPRDRAYEPARIATLVTAWLADELGPDALLLHPDAYWLWLPGGLPEELAGVLAPFATTGEAAQADHGFPEVAALGDVSNQPERAE